LNYLPALANQRVARWGLIISLVAFVALLQWQLLLNDVYWTGHWILVVWPPCIAVTIAGIVYFCDQPIRPISFLAHPVMIWLGNISFGVYLWHYPIMRAMALVAPDTWLSTWGSIVAMPIALLITLPIATLSYRLIERPLMGWAS